jgi:hypothetical protein
MKLHILKSLNNYFITHDIFFSINVIKKFRGKKIPEGQIIKNIIEKYYFSKSREKGQLALI